MIIHRSCKQNSRAPRERQAPRGPLAQGGEAPPGRYDRHTNNDSNNHNNNSDITTLTITITVIQ